VRLPGLARGMGWKLGADLVARVLQYVLLWAAARSLGQADFGDFTFALSIGYMLAQVADFGLQLFVQRELARLAIPGALRRPYFTDEAAAARLVGGGLVIKAVLSVAAMLLMALLVLVEPVGNKAPLLLIGFSMVLMTGLDYLSYCFRALRRLEYEATAIVVARCTNLLLGLGLLYLGAEVWGLAVAGNLAMLAALAFSYNRLLRYVRPDWRPDWTYWRRVSMQPTALGIGMVFSIISFRVDNLLIPPLISREALGVYNVAYKLYEPSLIIPSVVLAATFPLLSQAAKPTHGAGGLRDLLGQTSLLLFGLGFAATLALALFAAPVISLLYGEQYAASAPLLQVLAFGCLPMYLNYGLTHALIAMDKPHLYAAFTLLTLAVNVILNLALLPNIGTMGAAWATVATEASLLALCAAAVLRQVARMPSPAIAEGPL
jgi:O-antigen/teichoic acid export membrane protein